MARTPLAQSLQAAMANVERAHTRRELLAGAGAAGVAAAVAPVWLPAANAATAPRIAVVGAGLAGLTAAYRLKQAGYATTLYEGSDRIGGRCWTSRGAFAGGQLIERGGELIDQSHTAIRQLSQELGLKLNNLLAAQPNGTEDRFWFDGAPYTVTEAEADLNGIYQKLHRDVSEASYPTLYTGWTQRGYELDHMSIIDWINETVPGGVSSRLGQLLDVAYNIEYGAECSEQSALNLLYLLGYSGQGQLRLFGPSNEKYHVAGGNDQIVFGMAAKLQGQIQRDRKLTAIRRNTDRSYTLTFATGGRTVTVTADKVVLALPFSMLRSVDYSRAGFGTRKVTAIRELPMGTNAKLHVQFRNRPWYALHNNGNTYSDRGYQATWEVTRAQPGTEGILVDYTGGRIGASFGSGTPSSRAQQFLAQVEPVLPGLTASFNGRATVDHWTGYAWTKGSYSYWKVGQYTRFAGVEREVSHDCHFAGEHTSVDFQGYLNGAVETGQRAADEILAGLGRRSATATAARRRRRRRGARRR
jgi:monoamine oxidase